MWKLYLRYVEYKAEKELQSEKVSYKVNLHIKTLERFGYYTKTLHLENTLYNIAKRNGLEYRKIYSNTILKSIIIDDDVDLNCVLESYISEYPVNRLGNILNYISCSFMRLFHLFNSRKVKDSKFYLKSNYYTDVIYHANYVNNLAFRLGRYFSYSECMKILDRAFTEDNFYKQGNEDSFLKRLKHYSEVVKRENELDKKLRENELVLVGYTNAWKELVKGGFLNDFPGSTYDEVEHNYGAVYIRKPLVKSFNEMRQNRYNNDESFPIHKDDSIFTLDKRMVDFEKNLLSNLFRKS